MTEIRPGDPSEAEAILELHQASIRAFGPDAYRPAQVRALAATDGPEYPITDDDHRLVVAERDGRLAGFGDLDLMEPEITAIYVHPDHARSGAGTAILEDLEQTARSRGHEMLGLLASKNAVGFYAGAGYEQVATRFHDTGGESLECVWMKKQLI